MKKIFVHIILLSESDIPISWTDRLNYFWAIFIKMAPIAYILSIANIWFQENSQFSIFMIGALLLNMIVGVVYHLKYKTFHFQSFIAKNTMMVFITFAVYISLEMIRITAGRNIVGDAFRILIQVTTLLYPISKILKNVYILSNGKHPPEFIMKKLYDFEKNGDLSDFFKNKKEDE